MNNKTLMGFLVILALFMWSLNNQEAQQLTLRKQTLEQAARDSLATLDSARQNRALLSEVKADQPSATAWKAVPPAGLMKADVAEEDGPPAVLPKKIVVVTDNFAVTLDNRGAMIREITLFALENTDGVFPELLYDPATGMLDFSLDQNDFSRQLFFLDSNLPDTLMVSRATTLEFVWEGEEGRRVIRSFRFTPDGREFHQELKVEGFFVERYELIWNSGLRETEPFLDGGPMGNRYFFSEFVIHNGYNVLRETPKEKTVFNQETGNARWFGLRRKYVATLLQFDEAIEARVDVAPFPGKKVEEDPGTFIISVNDRYPAGGLAFDVVVLPLVHGDIESYGRDYGKIIFSGWEAFFRADIWFVGLCGLILRLLNFFYSLIPNYGVAIILLTLVVKFATLPLTLKQMRSMKKMQVHKPATDAIRKKFKSDPKKMNEEMMAYYKKAGINPFAQMAGCLPMFLQMPVFFSLFIVLGRALELRGAPFMLWIQDLSLPDVLTTAFSIPMVMPLGFSLLPFIMAFTTWLQTRQTMTDPNMKPMLYIMPVMIFVFSGVMPSGLVVYWIVSNLFSILQYVATNRAKVEVQPVIPAMPVGKKKSKKKK